MARCQPIIPDFVVSDCIFEAGRVTALALIHKDIFQVIYNNPSSTGVWVDGDYSADLHIFGEVRGEYAVTGVKIPGFGNESERRTNADHVLSVDIPGVKGNELFWNPLMKSNDFRVAFVVGGDYSLLYIEDKDVSIDATAPIENGLETEVVWKTVFTWKDFNNPKTSDVPVSVFN